MILKESPSRSPPKYFVLHFCQKHGIAKTDVACKELLLPDESAGPEVERMLRSTNYDCVVIGGGVRVPPRNLALFEVVINAIRRAAPNAGIAFNTRPDDSADGAARWVTAGSRAD